MSTQPNPKPKRRMPTPPQQQVPRSGDHQQRQPPTAAHPQAAEQGHMRRSAAVPSPAGSPTPMLEAAGPMPSVRRRPRRSRRSRGTHAANMVSLLAVGVAMFAGWVLWQQLQPPARQPAQPSTGDVAQSPAPAVMTPPSAHVAGQEGETGTAAGDGALRKPPRINRPAPPSVPQLEPPAEDLPDPTPPSTPDIDAELAAAQAAMAAGILLLRKTFLTPLLQKPIRFRQTPAWIPGGSSSSSPRATRNSRNKRSAVSPAVRNTTPPSERLRLSSSRTQRLSFAHKGRQFAAHQKRFLRW